MAARGRSLAARILVTVALAGAALGVTAATPAAAGAAGSARVTLLAEADHDTSPPLRDLPPATAPAGGSAAPKRPTPEQSPASRNAPQRAFPTFTTPMPGTTANFAGMDNINGYYPPDTNGDVGPAHYVQMVNSTLAIFDKAGTVLYGPVDINTLWGGFGGPCQNGNDGDPIVQYDGLSDRWLISQFSVRQTNTYECVAVSATSDPLGQYHRYAFGYGTVFPDYPKVGVWPDGYYVTYNMYGHDPDSPQRSAPSPGPGNTGATTCALERRAMLTGAPATQQCFNDPDAFSLQPADVDGPTPPPAGSPNYVVGVSESANDSLSMYRFAVDWDNPANSRYTGPITIPVDPFTKACTGDALDGFCVPQPGTAQVIDSMGPFTMYRLAYRNYGSHESLVVNHTVALDGNPGLTSQTGIRWYELRAPGADAPVVYQQGTAQSPVDGQFQFMASMAMDRQGNIGMGYSSSSTTLFPSINYIGRLAGDPLGTMPYAEGTIMAGGGSQTGSAGRWGDYTNTSVDPLDDCTFWHTNEYMKATSWNDWSTQIASFVMPGCTGSSSAPGAPASATAAHGLGQATVRWTPPTDNGNLPITGYTVTASPGGASCSTTVGVASDPLTCTVVGLTNGTKYTFEVKARNALGQGPAATAGSITPGSSLVTIPPVRVADTRPGQPVPFPAAKAPLAAGATLEVPIAGQFGVPADAAAGSLNVTAVGPAGSGHLTVYPCGQPQPQTSSLNYADGQTVANTVLAAIGADGKVCITTSNTTDVLVDLDGWFPVGAGFTAQAPQRTADTRPGQPVAFPAVKGPLPGGATLEVPIAGQFGVPADAAAVALNVTAAQPAGGGHLTVYPCGQVQPLASTLNYTTGQVVPNAAISAVGADGKVCVTTSTATNVIVDLDGWFSGPPGFNSQVPVRAADTRPGTPVAFPSVKAPLAAGSTLEVPIAGQFGVPADAGSASLNVTAVQPVGAGHLTVYPCGQQLPATSSLNYGNGQIVANAALAALGAGGRVCVTSSNSTEVLVDLNGWFPR